MVTTHVYKQNEFWYCYRERERGVVIQGELEQPQHEGIQLQKEVAAFPGKDSSQENALSLKDLLLTWYIMVYTAVFYRFL